MKTITLAALCLLILAGQSVQAQDARAVFLQIPGGVQSVFRDGERTIVQSRGDAYYDLTVSAENLRTDRLGAYRRPPTLRRPDMLPDGLVAVAGGSLREAYFTTPTSRYRHGVLGDSIESGGLRVLDGAGKVHDLRLEPDSVFEDLVPRIDDVDGDGRDELIVVRSYLEGGAATAVVGLSEGSLSIVAEAEAIGAPNRWLNPVGVADFDGDGTREIAVVLTPHIGGVLKLYEMRDGKLVEDRSARGFSNHFIGSRDLGMSHVADMNGDGVPDVVLPDAGRGVVRVITFAGGMFRELAAVALPARAQTAMVPVGQAPSVVAFGLANGVLAVIFPQ